MFYFSPSQICSFWLHFYLDIPLHSKYFFSNFFWNLSHFLSLKYNHPILFMIFPLDTLIWSIISLSYLFHFICFLLNLIVFNYQNCPSNILFTVKIAHYSWSCIFFPLHFTAYHWINQSSSETLSSLCFATMLYLKGKD